MKTNQQRSFSKAINNCIFFLLILILCCITISCKKYLDLKPDKKLVLPETLQDCQAILDNYSVMNGGIGIGEVGSDNYYMILAHWNAIGKPEKDLHVWDANVAPRSGAWSGPYNSIFYANQVLETLNKIGSTNDTQTWNTLKGSALFYRGYAFFQLTQVFCQPYKAGSAINALGIPLRLSPDVNIKAERGNLQKVYEQIIKDLQEATTLLPNTVSPKSRPGKAAAYAALARTYLMMQDYANAGVSADNSLKIYNTLIDYNSLNAADHRPFVKNNAEVLFNAVASGGLPLLSVVYKIDPGLYASYNNNDLRKSAFFNDNGNETFGFKGHYNDRLNEGEFFNGLTTDEMYLTRAECYARTGNTTSAMIDLNTLMKNRWSNQVTYPTFTAGNADDALSQILSERRKELILRGIRWSDLRRLNMDSRYAKTITRNLNNQIYSLVPQDLRYTWLIPLDALANTDMQQNPR